MSFATPPMPNTTPNATRGGVVSESADSDRERSTQYCGATESHDPHDWSNSRGKHYCDGGSSSPFVDLIRKWREGRTR